MSINSINVVIPIRMEIIDGDLKAFDRDGNEVDGFELQRRIDAMRLSPEKRGKMTQA